MKSGLPKKYARMGFKAGWKAYKKVRGLVSKSKNKTRSVRRIAKKYRRKRTQNQGIFKLPSGIMKPLSSLAYGFTRDKISDWISKTEIAKKLPASNFTDEAVMLATLFGARKLGLGKQKLVGSYIRHAETVEWARIGETLSDLQQAKKGIAMGGVPTQATSFR